LAGSYAKDPVLLAEVLSPSTMPNDRGLKLPFYQGIESLRAILLVYTNEVRIEHWQRTDTVWNEDVASGIEAAVALPVLGGSLTLADTYDGVAFTSIRTAQG
jgi:Uma2 family endonuclease